MQNLVIQIKNDSQMIARESQANQIDKQKEIEHLRIEF
jgi:hypothetical protein